MIVSPTDDDVFNALRSFLLDVLPTGVEVVLAQDNRVPEPISQNYVTMTPLRIPRLSTNLELQASVGTAATFMQSAQFSLQLDIHGPAATNNSNIISTMFRSNYSVAFFAAIGDKIAPLYNEDPRQMPFTSGEQQYENRYSFEVHLQVKQTVTTTLQSATALELELIDVETNSSDWPNSTISVP